jgi:hypothetical protein
MAIVAQGGSITLIASVFHANGSPADDPDITLTLLDAVGDPVTGFPVVVPEIVHVGLGSYRYDWVVPDAFSIGTYTAHWSATVDGSAVSGDETVDVVAAGSISSTLVSADDVRALVPTSLTDAQLLEVITREEASIANELYWPTGLGMAAVQTFYVGYATWGDVYADTSVMSPRAVANTWWIQPDRMEPLRLSRAADTVTVVDNGVAVASADIRLLRRGSMIERASGGWQGPIVTVTYMPADIPIVKRVVIELVRLTLTETGYQSERIGDYSYQKHVRAGAGSSTEATRRSLIRSIRPSLPAGSMRVVGSNESVRVGGVVA